MRAAAAWVCWLARSPHCPDRALRRLQLTPDDDDADWWERLNTYADDAPAPPTPRARPVGNRRRLHDRPGATYSVSQFSPGGGDAPWSAADGAYAEVEDRSAPDDDGSAADRRDGAAVDAPAPPAPAMTLYDALGCRRDAPAEELRRRYKDACRRCHPDARGGGDPERFAAVARAWAVLGDAKKRAVYDDGLRRR